MGTEVFTSPTSKSNISDEDVQTIKSIFEHYDADGNGTLDYQEATACVTELSALVNYTPKEDEIKALFAEMDQNGDEKIQFEEFLSAISEWWITDAKGSSS